MFKRKRHRQPQVLETIDLGHLDAVTGGRRSAGSSPSPEVINGIKQLGELISQVGSSMVQAKQQSSAQMMQIMQQMMQSRGR